MASALAADEPTVVKKAAAQAQGLARRTKDAAFIKVIGARTRDAGKLAGDFEAVTAARQRLKTTPGDPQANLLVGHYALCAAGDWDDALPKLSKSGDADWKELAAQELEVARFPTTFKEQLAVAEAWLTRAAQEPWPGRHYLQMRAAQWYREALPPLRGDDRDRVTARLKSLLAADEGLPAWELFQIQEAQRDGETVRLNRRGKVETLVEYGGPIDVSFVARTDGLNIRLFSHDHQSVIWNWERNTSELRVTRPDGRVIGSQVKPLEPNRWYAFRYVITPHTTTIFVDGAPVFAENQAYGAFRSSPVGIVSAADSVVDVRQLVVKPVE
jgi:hypothetical protein